MRLRFSVFVITLAHLALCAEGRAQTPAPSCPAVTVESRTRNPPWALGTGADCHGAPVTFTASAAGVGPAEKYTFRWTVSSGEIVDGQGTSSITVATQDAEYVVTATAELVGPRGLPADCDRTARATVSFSDCHRPCPSLSVSCPLDWTRGQPVSISAAVGGGDPGEELKYSWQVSAGTIIGGQGTPTITVDTSRLAGQNVTATVEVAGVPPECDRTESCTLPFVCTLLGGNRKFDEYGDLGAEQEDERLADFAAQLRQEPGAQGYVFYFGPRDVETRVGRVWQSLTGKFGIDPGRITMRAGHGEKFAAQLWVSPAGAGEPRPTEN